jgi:hypothetical protein
MGKKEICPCVNLHCVNHGDCEKCTSAHLKQRSLHYCAFYSVLAELQEAMAASPESPTAKRLATMIEPRLATYRKRMEKYGLSEEREEKLLEEVADFNDPD